MADRDDKALSTWDKWRQRAANAQANADKRKAKQSKQLFLPGFDIGTMPNHINRSSLFAPVARGRRKFHNDEELISRRDCRLLYTGEQLDEADADLIMALIYFAQPYPIGENVPITIAELLRKMGRTLNKRAYEWLRRRMRELTKATLFLEAYKRDGGTRYRLGHEYGFHILSAFYYDEDDGTYYYWLDPRWVQLFSNREYALLDWDARLQIGRGQDMAKTLQRLVATTSDSVQRYALDRLKAQMQYGSPMRKFRQALTVAVAELKRVGVIIGGRIETSTKGKTQLVIYIPDSKAAVQRSALL